MGKVGDLLAIELEKVGAAGGKFGGGIPRTLRAEWSNIVGRVHTRFDPRDLAAQLATTGLPVEVMTRCFCT
jgi:hypothetical protein